MLEITYKKFPKKFSIDLPISKSIVARELALDYIHNTPLAARMEQLKGYFIPDDIQHISNALLRLEERRRKGGHQELEVWVGQSGTAYRFLVVLALFESGDTIITHDPQLTARIKPQDFMPFIEIGADIRLDIKHHKTIVKASRAINGVIDDTRWGTSQFSSAILLAQPLHKNKIALRIDRHRPSFSYYELTQSVIQAYNKGVAEVEGDWSAAAFWYQLMVLHPEIEEIKLVNLNPTSAQPDRALAEAFNHFGIHTDSHNMLTLSRTKPSCNPLQISIAQNLDLFPSIIITALWLGLPFEISGIRNLRFKESDRIVSMVNNLSRLGMNNLVVEEDRIIGRSDSIVTRGTINKVAKLYSYDDHRIAMAFGVLATSIPGAKYSLIGEEAVNKSYPSFFETLLSL